MGKKKPLREVQTLQDMAAIQSTQRYVQASLDELQMQLKLFSPSTLRDSPDARNLAKRSHELASNQEKWYSSSSVGKGHAQAVQHFFCQISL
jgi:hypothetical protein